MAKKIDLNKRKKVFEISQGKSRYDKKTLVMKLRCRSKIRNIYGEVVDLYAEQSLTKEEIAKYINGGFDVCSIGEFCGFILSWREKLKPEIVRQAIENDVDPYILCFDPWELEENNNTENGGN